MELTIQEKMEKVKDLRPIDDVFFEVFANDTGVCEEMLRVILEDPNLIVTDVIVQNSEKNIYGRSVRLDALCILGSGSRVNIEVQRSDNEDHLKRARFNAASITVKDSNFGDKFKDIVDVYIIYISEFDFLKEKKTIYHIDKVIRETGTVIDDGQYEIFVNTEIKDGTDISELMDCFTQTEIDNAKFPTVSKRMKELKTTEGGVGAVCEIMRKYEEIAAAQAAEAARKETTIKTTVENSFEFDIPKEQTINLLMKKCNLSEQEANDQYEKYAPVTV